MDKVSIIGGSGFIGTYLCRELKREGVPFEIVDLKKSKSFPTKTKIGDVRDIESLRKTVNGKIVILLAAVHRDDVKDQLEYFNTNVKGAENVSKVCEEKKIKKIVFTSSVAVYGFSKSVVGEDGEINPYGNYGKSKYTAEEILRAWQLKGPNQLIIVRPTVVFGIGNRGNLYNLMKQVIQGYFLMIGNGKNKKSIAYIENVVAFLKACIFSKQANATFNYVDSPDLSMNKLTSIIRKQYGKENKVNLKVPYLIGLFFAKMVDIASYFSGKRFFISSIRIRKFCASTQFKSQRENLDGFVQPVALGEGLRRTIVSEFINPDQSREVFFTE